MYPEQYIFIGRAGRTRRCRKHRRGITIAEALISLVICTSLLTAVASGIVAASNAVRTNDEFFRATQAARVILLQLEEQIRSGWLDPTVTLDAEGKASQIRLIVHSVTAQPVMSPDRTYKYDAANKQLVLVTNAYPADADFVLARNITAGRFSIEKGLDANGYMSITQVGITLTVQVGKNQVTMSGSAAPRRSLQK